MEKFHLELKHGKICCHRFGSGAKLLIAIHGFGDQGKSYASFEKGLGDRYSIIAADLPFHGETNWTETFYNRDDLLALIENILKIGPWQNFDLIGHSLGGTIALSISSHFGDTLDNLFLLAPGGVTVKDMAIPDMIPVSIRKWLAKNLKSGLIINLAESMKNLKLLDAYSLKVLKHHLGNRANRDRLLQTWVSEYYFRLSLSKLETELAKRKKENTHFLFGKNDPLILTDKIESKLGSNSNIHYLEGGHRLINAQTARYLRDLITI